jgi:hypothetical protein
MSRLPQICVYILFFLFYFLKIFFYGSFWQLGFGVWVFNMGGGGFSWFFLILGFGMSLVYGKKNAKVRVLELNLCFKHNMVFSFGFVLFKFAFVFSLVLVYRIYYFSSPLIFILYFLRFWLGFTLSQGFFFQHQINVFLLFFFLGSFFQIIFPFLF